MEVGLLTALDATTSAGPAGPAAYFRGQFRELTHLSVFDINLFTWNFTPPVYNRSFRRQIATPLVYNRSYFGGNSTRPHMPQDGQRDPKGRPKAPKGTPKGAKGTPKSGQRKPKDSQRSQKGTKVGPREAKGAPKTPKGSQSKPKQAKASQRTQIYKYIYIYIYIKTPDQPPKRTLCYPYELRSATALGRFME